VRIEPRAGKLGTLPLNTPPSSRIPVPFLPCVNAVRTHARAWRSSGVGQERVNSFGGSIKHARRPEGVSTSVQSMFQVMHAHSDRQETSFVAVAQGTGDLTISLHMQPKSSRLGHFRRVWQFQTETLEPDNLVIGRRLMQRLQIVTPVRVPSGDSSARTARQPGRHGEKWPMQGTPSIHPTCWLWIAFIIGRPCWHRAVPNRDSHIPQLHQDALIPRSLVVMDKLSMKWSISSWEPSRRAAKDHTPAQNSEVSTQCGGLDPVPAVPPNAQPSLTGNTSIFQPSKAGVRLIRGPPRNTVNSALCLTCPVSPGST